MAAARVANAPHLSLYDPAPGERAWQAPRRPVARWLGIGGCVLLLGLLLIIMLSQPIGAGIGG